MIIILIAIGIWQFYFNNGSINEVAEIKRATPQQLSAAKNISQPKNTYQCDGRQHCSQMRSYEEAKYFLQHCPNTKMDGDHDGIPCERQFQRW